MLRITQKKERVGAGGSSAQFFFRRTGSGSRNSKADCPQKWEWECVSFHRGKACSSLEKKEKEKQEKKKKTIMRSMAVCLVAVLWKVIVDGDSVVC